VADGVDARTGETNALALPVRACRDGCEVEMRAVMTWDGPPADAVRSRWNAELSIVYENNPPSAEAVTARIVEGHGPTVGRAMWLAAGALVALLSGTPWIALGNRLARVRIGLAALCLISPAWLLVQVAAADFAYAFEGFSAVDFETLLIAAAATFVGLGIAIGIVRTERGDAVALPAAGWAYLVVVGYLLWLGVEHFATYRPHELAVLAAGLGIPGVAALTAVPPGRPAGAGLRFGTSFVLASMLAELAVTIGVAGWLAVTYVVSIVGRGRPIDLVSLLVGAIPIVVAAGFVLGLRLWPSGNRWFLWAASTATLLFSSRLCSLPSLGWVG